MTMEFGRLTAVQLKSLEVGKHFDGGGLFLHVKSNGARYWRLKYRHGGKEGLQAFGAYPEVGLAEARRRRDEARAMLRDRKSPGAARKAMKLADRQAKEAAFPTAALAWLENRQKSWAPETYRKAEYVTRTYLVPRLGRTSISTLNTQQASDALEEIAKRAPTLAVKARQYLAGIVTFAIRRGLREDGRILSLRGAVPKHDKGHIPAATDPREIAELAKAIDAYPTPVTRAALKLTMLTAMRPGVVAGARWRDIDLERGEWTAPAELMKMGHAHIVPLPKQAIESLRQMLAYTEGHEFVFPPLARQKNLHLHRDAMSKALRDMGFRGKHATHGFRGMFRTVARERLGFDSDVLEAQLGHAKKGEVQRAYDRTTFIRERHRLMQEWANYLDKLKQGGKANVTSIRRKSS